MESVVSTQVSPQTSSDPARPHNPPINADFPWDSFDSEWYYDHNYSGLRLDDRDIIENVRDFFIKEFVAQRLRFGSHGVDVGSGANLYPSLAMLPFCSRIELWEYSASNVDWLNKAIKNYGPSWDDFWKEFVVKEPYSGVNPRVRLPEVARVVRDSVFNLPEGHWDVGTMFFVAESLTSDHKEFNAALTRFIRALKPGAPFAAAFMKDSEGYSVDGQKYPAIAIEADDVTACLASLTEDLRSHSVKFGDRLREGYSGMILATGRRARR